MDSGHGPIHHPAAVENRVSGYLLSIQTLPDIRDIRKRFYVLWTATVFWNVVVFSEPHHTRQPADFEDHFTKQIIAPPAQFSELLYDVSGTGLKK
jgi:hypothetical protein